jgi:phosphoglycolate phosphatase
VFDRVSTIFFDLDGTLIDSVPDLALAVDAMLRQLGLPPRGEARVREWVGNGADNLIRRALAGDLAGEVPAERVECARPLFKAAYREHLCVHTRVYPGVREGLTTLRARGYRLACITNKPTEFAVPLVEQLGIGVFFEQVLGGDCTPAKKPAPDALLLTAERMRVPIGDVLMVGDSRNDVLAARHAGCPVAAVPYGYNHGEDIRAAQPDVVIDSLDRLPTLLRTMTSHDLL